MGGQSAFGTKAGDLFTRITMITAAVWLLLCLMAVKVLTSSPSGPFGSASSSGSTDTVTPAKSSDDGKADKSGGAAGTGAGAAPSGAAPSGADAGGAAPSGGAAGGAAPAGGDAPSGGTGNAPAGDPKP
jgi:preprotein translocase subunit SecG